MRIVTRLKAADRRGARTVVELDGEVWNDLDTEVVLDRQLFLGLELDDDALQDLLREDAFVRARRAAARLLHARPRAVAELRSRLVERGFSPDAAERAIDYFTEKGDLDDARFARLFARNMLKTRTVGPRRVREELRRLGVADGLIAEALVETDAAGDDAQHAKAQRLVERRLRGRLAREPFAAKHRKLYQLLLRAGFEPSVIAPVLREALDGAAECDENGAADAHDGFL